MLVSQELLFIRSDEVDLIQCIFRPLVLHWKHVEWICLKLPSTLLWVIYNYIYIHLFIGAVND